MVKVGIKNWILVYSDGNVHEKLNTYPALDREATNRLVARLYPNENLELIDEGDLFDMNPPNNKIYAACYPSVNILAAKEFALDYPSKLAKRFIAESDYSEIYLHAMHSVVDWHAFAVWKNRQLIRSLSLSTDTTGILEDVGEKLDFELDYWQGKYPAVNPEEYPDYPFPFHPLDLAEATREAFLGYVLEGMPKENHLDPGKIPLMIYKRRKYLRKFW